MSIEVIIEALGVGGDGIASHNGEKLFVAGALPGERVRVTPAVKGCHAKLVERLSEASGRQTPPCGHFGTCGGCVAQHMAGTTYVEWKRAMIIDALSHRGFSDVPIAPVIASPPASRRRVRLAVASPRGKAAPDIGFRRRSSHRIVAIARCAVLLPELETLLAPLGRLVTRLGGGVSEISLTAAPHGRDVILHGLAGAPDLAMREALSEFAHAEGIQRLSVEYSVVGRDRRRHGHIGKQNRQYATVLETIVQPGAVQAIFGKVVVDLPPGAFLQPTAAGEAAIQRLVRKGLALDNVTPDGLICSGGKGAHVADFYAGLGSIGFSLTPPNQVMMFEGNPTLAKAAHKAAGGAGRTVVAKARDLTRQPLAPGELNRFDAVIFDPPRTGAPALVKALAASEVPRVAAVSCNPATFARDARVLVDGGYHLAALTPIDQFLWSRHIELVSIFNR